MRKLKTFTASISALLATGVLAPTALAAPCDGKDVDKPFLPWQDKHNYALVDDGSFTGGAADWSLLGDALAVPGGNTLLADSSDAALQLGAGSSATSPRVCVTHGNPTARMFATQLATEAAAPESAPEKPDKPENDGQGDAGGAQPDESDRPAKLKVEVIYMGADGVRKVKRSALLKPGEEWHPTRKFSLAQGRFKVRPGSGGKAWIKLRFTAKGDGGWLIDDVYVDPRRRS